MKNKGPKWKNIGPKWKNKGPKIKNLKQSIQYISPEDLASVFDSVSKRCFGTCKRTNATAACNSLKQLHYFQTVHDCSIVKRGTIDKYSGYDF